MKALYDFLITEFRQVESKQTGSPSHLLLNFNLISILFCSVYTIVCQLIAFTPALYLNLVLVLLFFINVILYRTSLPLWLIAHLFLVDCLAGLATFAYLSGGAYSIILPWLSFIPITAILLFNLKKGLIWLIPSLLVIIVFLVLGTTPNYLPRQWRFIYQIVINVGLVSILTWITSLFSYSKDKAQKLLEKQNLELKIQKEEMLVQNEELIQQREEIVAQRDFIEQNNQEMKFLNNKLGSSEKVLRKAVMSLKTSKEKIHAKNIELEQRDKFIQKSIQSAVTIQEAMLPYQQKMDELLVNYFVIYRPKDKVSGDFYWLNKIGDQIILIAADCTGHGVPGAFMTMIGNTLLDKIIRVWNITDPASILERLHTEIQIVLRQHETHNINGMDAVVVALQTLDATKVQLTFSGAKSPLYYSIAGASTLQQLYGNRKSIGGIQDETRKFTNQVITLPKGSLLYIGSDGLKDQNDVRRKKFGKLRLMELLTEISPLPLVQQKQAIATALDLHMQDTTQRDDILWIGLKL